MQKIGLVSYHYYKNYGTCLQAFALQYIIAHKFKASCEYIDFGQSEYPGMFPKKTYWRVFKSFIRKLLSYKYTLADGSSTRAFLRFKKNCLRISTKYEIDDLKKLETIYDKFIVGSDQTWNPKACNKEYYPLMMLSFVKEANKKFSYAPSLGGIVEKDAEKLLKNQLASFCKISTREHKSQLYLSKILNRNVDFVLDPTLLVKAEEWDVITKNYSKQYCGYVLCYQLGSRSAIYEFARKLSSEKHIKLLAVTISSKLKKSADIYPSGIGPFEFVQLIRNADYVVTDSFHGTAFSLNFNKQFFSFYKHEGGRSFADNRRIYDFLESYGLAQRIVDENKYDESEIIFDFVNDKMEVERQESFLYLKSILEQ